MRRFLTLIFACALIGAGIAWVLSAPDDLPKGFAEGLGADADKGAMVFAAAGCASCHAAPEATGEDKLVLTGGTEFVSDFGAFYAPNISPDLTHGIGSWSQDQFARAVIKGVSPRGAHYYPAFPYTSYARMTAQDVTDLYAYMLTLPAATTPSKPHDVGFPFNIRRSVGLWKLLFASDAPVLTGDLDAELLRGRYLVEGLAHCAECHTPRNALGALDRSNWMTGAPNPSGKGRIPGITPSKLDWSEGELVEYFTSGFTPEYDSAGGSMADVISNLAQLPESDRAAIAAYLKALPPAE